MPTNVYFNNFPSRYTQEQALVEDLIVEAIKMYGSDCYYIIRDSADGSERDLIYGEDPTSHFSKVYKMEMYISESMDHAAGGDFLSQFGLQINENMNLLMSRRTFKRYVPTEIAIRPREGDLIYVPLLTNLYEIKFVEHEKNFYTLGRDVRLPYMYEMRCELFKFSNELINTGVEEIDEIQVEEGYTISLNLNLATNSGNVNYYMGETVYQGTTYQTATATAVVGDWDGNIGALKIFNIKGVFSDSANGGIRGVSSNAYYSIANYDPQRNNSDYDSYQNQEFETENDTVVVTNENNPFGNA